MRVLVTGGAGFIGSALVRLLLAEGEEAAVLDKLTYAASPATLAPHEDHPGFSFRRADINDAAAMERAFAEIDPDAVMHLAAESHVDRSIEGSADFIATNVAGTHVLLEAALRHWRGISSPRRDAFRFVHISTDEVFGSLGAEGLFCETTAYDPSSPYSASKAASDHLVRAWGRTYGLPVLVSNCSNNYGPYQFPEKLIPLIILNALEGKPLPVYGDGRNVRDWLHVEDHVRALKLMLAKGRPGETYAVGGRSEQANIDVVYAICDCLDALRPTGKPRRSLITFVADRPGHDRRYAIDPAKIERDLGWRPRHDFQSGLMATVEWYLANPDWWTPLREKVYAGQRLGAAKP